MQELCSIVQERTLLSSKVNADPGLFVKKKGRTAQLIHIFSQPTFDDFYTVRFILVSVCYKLQVIRK